MGGMRLSQNTVYDTLFLHVRRSLATTIDVNIWIANRMVKQTDSLVTSQIKVNYPESLQ